MSAAMLAVTAPSPLWFATRGAGAAVLVLLTLSVILGVGTAQRWEGRRTPRLTIALIHRNISLLGLVLLVVHVVTAVADPFAAMGWRDALIPFGGTYRPVWVGIGALSMELLVAVGITTALRFRIGPRLWKVTHLLAYAAWPLAVIHSAGAGTDVARPWFLGLVAGCVAAVLIALVRRLAHGRWRTLPVRIALVAGLEVLAGAGVVGMTHGPLRPDWPLLAGTPRSILLANRPTPAPAHPPGRPFQDRLAGVAASQGGATYVSMRDLAEPSWTVMVTPPGPSETLPTLTIRGASSVICATPVTVGATFYGECGHVRVEVALFRTGSALTGTLTTSGPLP